MCSRPKRKRAWKAEKARRESTQTYASLKDFADKIGTSFKDSIIASYLNNSASRMLMANTMIAPIRRNIDYQSYGRKIFPVEAIPDPKCDTCGVSIASIFYGPVVESNCPECVTREVMDC